MMNANKTLLILPRFRKQTEYSIRPTKVFIFNV